MSFFIKAITFKKEKRKPPFVPLPKLETPKSSLAPWFELISLQFLQVLLEQPPCPVWLFYTRHSSFTLTCITESCSSKAPLFPSLDLPFSTGVLANRVTPMLKNLRGSRLLPTSNLHE